MVIEDSDIGLQVLLVVVPSYTIDSSGRRFLQVEERFGQTVFVDVLYQSSEIEFAVLTRSWQTIAGATSEQRAISTSDFTKRLVMLAISTLCCLSKTHKKMPANGLESVSATLVPILDLKRFSAALGPLQPRLYYPQSANHPFALPARRSANVQPLPWLKPISSG